MSIPINTAKELLNASERFDQVLKLKTKIVLIKDEHASADTVFSLYCAEAFIRNKKPGIKVVHANANDFEWYEFEDKKSPPLIISVNVDHDKHLIALSNIGNTFVISDKLKSYKDVLKHNSQFEPGSNNRIEFGLINKDFSASAIVWGICNYDLYRVGEAVIFPKAIQLINTHTSAYPNKNITLEAAFYEYLNTLDIFDLELTKEILSSEINHLANLARPFIDILQAKNLIALQTVKKKLSPLTIKEYRASFLRANISEELMDIVGGSVFVANTYLVLYEIHKNILRGRVYYGDNWDGKQPINAEVSRLQYEIKAQVEKYGFSFEAKLKRTMIRKTPLDILVNALLENK